MENSKKSSSNKAQTEQTLDTLHGKEALKKLRDLATSAQTCFFCNHIKTGLPMSVRPMSVLQVDDEGNLWFMSHKDSEKNEELKADSFTHLFFQENKNSGFLNIYGISEISFDKQKIEELWNPLLKVWFQEGIEDPAISLIKVMPTQVYYWDNKNGDMIAFAKMALSLVIGKTMDDNVRGELDI
jgi:general stress protein 26